MHFSCQLSGLVKLSGDAINSHDMTLNVHVPQFAHASGDLGVIQQLFRSPVSGDRLRSSRVVSGVICFGRISKFNVPEAERFLLGCEVVGHLEMPVIYTERQRKKVARIPPPENTL